MQKSIYPDWVCRFYVDDTVPKDIITRLTQEGAEIINVKNLGPELGGGIGGMFWRFLPAADPTVGIFSNII